MKSMRSGAALVLSLLFVLLILPSASCGGGTGERVKITFICVDDRGEEKTFPIDTDERYLRGALENEGLIKGEESTYGLFVTEVCGITALYEKGAYWALYIDGEYATTGVSSTKLKDGSVYKFVYTRV